jgi:hypothetical protein
MRKNQSCVGTPLVAATWTVAGLLLLAVCSAITGSTAMSEPLTHGADCCYFTKPSDAPVHTWLGLAALIVVALLEARFDLSIAQLLTPWWRHAPLASETSLRC